MTLLEDLYENYRGLVFNVVRQFTNNYDKAEDLTQEVFCKVCRTKKIPDFKDDGEKARWLTVIAKRIAIDAYRTERRRVPMVSMFDWLEDVYAVPVREGPPEIDLDSCNLSARQRVLIEECYWEGLKNQELADRHGIKVGTVKIHLHRAKQKIRDFLESPVTEF